MVLPSTLNLNVVKMVMLTAVVVHRWWLGCYLLISQQKMAAAWWPPLSTRWQKWSVAPQTMARTQQICALLLQGKTASFNGAFILLTKAVLNRSANVVWGTLPIQIPQPACILCMRTCHKLCTNALIHIQDIQIFSRSRRQGNIYT